MNISRNKKSIIYLNVVQWVHQIFLLIVIRDIKKKTHLRDLSMKNIKKIIITRNYTNYFY